MGRPRIDVEIRRLIRTMAQDGWGAPRIHAELLKLGFIISEKTVSRYMPRRQAQPDQVKRWVAFLRNHKDDIAAMDLFTVATASLRWLFGFFVIEHGRRHILHFNATFHPTADWVMRQLREAFPYDTAPRYLIFDHDSIFSPAVVRFVRALGIDPIRTSYRSPWQNGTAERWILSCRRELLEHVVVFGERVMSKNSKPPKSRSQKKELVEIGRVQFRCSTGSHRARARLSAASGEPESNHTSTR